jgi:hypothetical protein
MEQHMQLHGGKIVSSDTGGMQLLREGNLERHENTTGACEQYMYKLSLIKKNESENKLENEEEPDDEKQL